MGDDDVSNLGRSELLAKMAATVAAGIEANTNTAWMPSDIAERAVTIAEAIVARVEGREA